MTTLLHKKVSQKKTDEIELEPLISNPLQPPPYPVASTTGNPFSYFNSGIKSTLYPSSVGIPVQPTSPFIPAPAYPSLNSPPQPYPYPTLPGAFHYNIAPPMPFSSSVVAGAKIPTQFPNYPSSHANIYPVLEQPVQSDGVKSPKQQPKPQSQLQLSQKGKENSVKEKVNENGGKEVATTTTEDEIITKRCKRCSLYYVESELAQSENKTPCKYHPGTLRTGYSSALFAGAKLQYWTCCKSSNKSDPGCKSGKHIEDQQMTSILRNAPPTQPPKIGVLIDFVPAPPETLEKPKENIPKKPEKTKNLIRHYVTDADTLIGISFRYHVTPQSIRQLNRMVTDDVQGYSKLYIPRNGAQVNISEIESDQEDEEEGPPANLSPAERALFEKRMLMKLRAQTGIANEEASYYLNMYGWAYTAALKEYQDDLEWEKTHPKKVTAKKCK